MKLEDQFYQIQHRDLYNFIRSRVNNDTLAEDILQDVFLKIHSHIGTVINTKKLQSWVFQIARHTIIDHYRTNKITRQLPVSISDPSNENDIKQTGEIASWLKSLIKQLPLIYRDVLLLSDIKGIKQKEAALKLGISVPALKSRLLRGRAKLKNLLLECCLFEFDFRGIPIDYKLKKGNSDLSCCS